MIAVGIFLTPAGMAKSLGSPLWLLIIWLVMGTMALSGALCYGELAARFPHAGGGYVYLREAYGPVVAFLYGWKCLLVMDPGITAALATGLASYAGYSLQLSPLGVKTAAIAAIALLAAINIFGVRFGAGLMRWLTLLKLGALIFISVLGSLAGLMMAAPRVYFAMARDGVFLRGVARAHSRFGTPARAIILQATLASLFVLLGTFNQIVSFFIFVTVIFIALTVAAIFILRRRHSGDLKYSAPGYPVTPIIFLVLVSVLLLLLGGHNPVQALLGVVAVALGAPVYYLLFRHSFKKEEVWNHDLDSNDSAL